MTEPNCSAFQEHVLATLHRGGLPADVACQVAALAPTPEVSDWVATWDPDMVQLAIELVGTWSVLRPAPKGQANDVG